VERVERPVLRDALRQEFDSAALLDAEVQVEAPGRLQDRSFLLLVIEDPLSLDLGRHEQQ
jgi:hypothetical protein